MQLESQIQEKNINFNKQLTVSLKPIPYGVSSYKSIRDKGSYYVDKTPYIPKIETAGDFLFMIRPRRFGKSSLLTYGSAIQKRVLKI